MIAFRGSARRGSWRLGSRRRPKRPSLTANRHDRDTILLLMGVGIGAGAVLLLVMAGVLPARAATVERAGIRMGDLVPVRFCETFQARVMSRPCLETVHAVGTLPAGTRIRAVQDMIIAEGPGEAPALRANFCVIGVDGAVFRPHAERPGNRNACLGRILAPDGRAGVETPMTDGGRVIARGTAANLFLHVDLEGRR